jgi:hypothetical protein
LIKWLVNRFFADVPRVSAKEAEVEFGGFADAGPVTADYAAAFVDEKGDAHLFPFPHRRGLS